MKYEKELEVLKRLYEAGAFKPDFYNKEFRFNAINDNRICHIFSKCCC